MREKTKGRSKCKEKTSKEQQKHQHRQIWLHNKVMQLQMGAKDLVLDLIPSPLRNCVISYCVQSESGSSTDFWISRLTFKVDRESD